MFRTAAATLIALSVAGLPAFAADSENQPAIADQARILASNLDLAAATQHAEALRRAALQKDSRPAILPALYAGSASLQALDFYSTRRALSNGAHEANPMMNGVVSHAAAFAVVKAATAALPMLAAEKLWRTNRKAAIITMVIQNSVMAAVAANNARTLHHQGR